MTPDTLTELVEELKTLNERLRVFQDIAEEIRTELQWLTQNRTPDPSHGNSTSPLAS